MKFVYQTKTKQYNDQSHLVCVELGFILIERTLITIGQCIGWLSVWYANFIDFEDPIDICLEIVVW